MKLSGSLEQFNLSHIVSLERDVNICQDHALLPLWVEIMIMHNHRLNRSQILSFRCSPYTLKSKSLFGHI